MIVVPWWFYALRRTFDLTMEGYNKYRKCSLQIKFDSYKTNVINTDVELNDKNTHEIINILLDPVDSRRYNYNPYFSDIRRSLKSSKVNFLNIIIFYKIRLMQTKSSM